jgi:uncharacterized membrane protein YjjP (DUF1212 family)
MVERGGTRSRCVSVTEESKVSPTRTGSPHLPPSPMPSEREEHSTQRQDNEAATACALNCVLRFGELMLRAGTTAFRVREGMGRIARAMGIEALAVHLMLGGMTVTGRSGDAQVTLAREIAPLGINASRIEALERLARTAELGVAPLTVAARLDAIEIEPPVHSLALVVAAVGAASGASAFLSGGGPLVILASLIGSAVGQALRLLLLGRRLNQYAVTAVCSAIASGVYCLIAAALSGAGFAVPDHAAGFISSVLFLVPGFSLVAALLDLVQHQTAAGISRLAYGGLVLVSAAFGLSLVAAVAGLSVQTSPPPPLSEVETLLLRALASVVGACGFAILFNSSWRTVLAVGGLALVGNELRLALCDAGVTLALATFVGALTVGLLASLVRHHLHEPRIALTVPGITIMVPGTYAFQTVVLFNQGDALAGLRTAVLGGFVVGAMAAGLACARFVSEPSSLVES